MALELLNAATEFVDLGEWANFSSKHPSLVWLKNRRRATGEGVRSVGPVLSEKQWPRQANQLRRFRGLLQRLPAKKLRLMAKTRNLYICYLQAK